MLVPILGIAERFCLAGVSWPEEKLESPAYSAQRGLAQAAESSKFSLTMHRSA